MKDPKNKPLDLEDQEDQEDQEETEHIEESEPDEDLSPDLELLSEDRNLPTIQTEHLPAIYSPVPSHIHNIDAYIRSVNQIPMLTEQEERELALKLKYHGDIEAAQKLILSHLRFVVKVARGFSGYGLPQADLIQEGNIGLMKAVKRYDPDVGVRLVSFAVHWIKSEMHEFIIRNWRLVKIATTKAQRKLFFNLRSRKTRLGWFTPEEIQEVAKELNVKPSEVIEMESRLNAYDSPFDAPVDSDDEDTVYTPSMYLSSPNSNPEYQAMEEELENKTHEKLIEGLRQLDPRAQDILKRRFLDDDKATLHELAAQYNISAERVRQIENQALKSLKSRLTL